MRHPSFRQTRWFDCNSPSKSLHTCCHGNCHRPHQHPNLVLPKLRKFLLQRPFLKGLVRRCTYLAVPRSLSIRHFLHGDTHAIVAELKIFRAVALVNSFWRPIEGTSNLLWCHHFAYKILLNVCLSSEQVAKPYQVSQTGWRLSLLLALTLVFPNTVDSKDNSLRYFILLGNMLLTCDLFISEWWRLYPCQCTLGWSKLPDLTVHQEKVDFYWTVFWLEL